MQSVLRIGGRTALLFVIARESATSGSESAALSNLFSGPAGIFGLAAAVAQPIFSGGRQEAGIAAAAERRAATVEMEVEAAMLRAMKSSEFVSGAQKLQQPLFSLGGREYQRMLEERAEAYRQIVTELGIKE